MNEALILEPLLFSMAASLGFIHFQFNKLDSFKNENISNILYKINPSKSILQKTRTVARVLEGRQLALRIKQEKKQPRF